MKHLFLINPAAGKHDRTGWYHAAIQSAFVGRDDPYEIAVSRAPGHCTAMTREAAASGEELRVYACGGDGTLNEVVNGAAGFSTVAVTHFPGGSGNDFIKIFSDPSAFRELPRLIDGDETTFDLIRAGEDHYALNICSVGFDARIGTEILHYKRLPFVTGSGAYVLSAVVNTLRGTHEPYEITLDDGEVFRGERTLVCLLNGRWYGGSFHPVPEARPDDGQLDVLIVEPVSRLTVARVIGKYKDGLYADYPQYITHRRCRKVRIAAAKPMAVNLDGELLRQREMTFTLLDRKIRFFYPRGLTWHSTAGENGSNTAQKEEIIR